MNEWTNKGGFTSLKDAIEKMTEDSKRDGFGDWERSGHKHHRFERKIEWFEGMVKDYAAKLNMDADEVVRMFEAHRTYWWPNYYQPANFPKFDHEGFLGVFETLDDLKKYARENWDGFKCPFCGDISWNPSECNHRILKDGVCDYTSGGLIDTGYTVLVKEIRIVPIPIMPPVERHHFRDVTKMAGKGACDA